MRLHEKLKKLRDALTGLTVGVYHYRRPKNAAPFAVWQESGEGDSFHADNGKKEQAITGTLDYFTRTEFDPVADEIQDILEATCSGWKLLSVQYEEETDLIHFEWEWEMV